MSASESQQPKPQPPYSNKQRRPEVPEIAGGANLNDLGIPDPTRKGASIYVSPVSGTSVRQGLPAPHRARLNPSRASLSEGRISYVLPSWSPRANAHSHP